MLTARAVRYLDGCDRRPAVATADVDRMLRRTGEPVPQVWLEFHDRYAGYVERIWQETAVWGLAHDQPVNVEPRSVGTDVIDGTRYVYCADVHPSYDYRLDGSGRFECDHSVADTFDVHVERLAVWHEFYASGRARRVWDSRLSDPEFRAALLASIADRRVPEASDSSTAWYVAPDRLVVDDLTRSALKVVLLRGAPG